MRPERDLWRAVRWSLLLILIACVGIGIAAMLDRTPSRDWALPIGGPALTVLLPLGLVWLVVAVVVYVVRGRRANRATRRRLPGR
jgi:hypothetical protein